jgi:two-component system phosphate regulon sensor histidine kinase PhoR
VDAAAREVDARVTIVAPDGRVLADSALSGADLRAVENHGGRPEVKGALAGQPTRAERRSATVGVPLLYAAVPIRHEGKVVGVARLSRGIDRIQAQGRELWRTAAIAGLLALAATALASLLLSASLGRSLAEIMDTARQLAAGNLAARIRVRREDELGELTRIINQSADELQRRLAEIARDRGRTDAILSAMDDGVLAVDHQGIVTLANPSLTRALALASPLGRHYLETIRQPEVARCRGRAEDRRAPRVEVEVLQLRRAFTITGVPFPGAEGARHGAVLTFNDSTERQRLDAMRRDFVANASHELRTPLTSDPRLRRGARGRRQGRAGHRRALPRQDPHARGPHGVAGRGPARAVAPRVERPRAGAGRDAPRRRRSGRGGLVRGAGGPQAAHAAATRRSARSPS